MRRSVQYLTMLVFLLIAATAMTWLTQASAREVIPPRENFTAFPEQIGKWKRVDTQTLNADVLEKLKPDDYVSATYVDPQGYPAYLFIGYYGTQRQGKTYHSPQNCLPGAGWVISRRGRYSLDSGQGDINNFLISKEDSKLLTLYWYHGRGRVVASEYWGKFYSVEDAVLRRRTDGSLVRVMLPVEAGNEKGEQRALELGQDFVRELLPQLPRFIPD